MLLFGIFDFWAVITSAGKRGVHIQKSTTATVRCETSRYDFYSQCKHADAQLRRNSMKSIRQDWQSMRFSVRKPHFGREGVQWDQGGYLD